MSEVHMTDTTYNGWTNYATWRVNLEIFDGMNPHDMTGQSEIDEGIFAEVLKGWAEEIIYNDCPNGGLAADYAMAFLQEVNWREIAQHMIADYA
jgi:hypothetical protein